MKSDANAEPADLTPFARGLLEKYGKSAGPPWRVLQSGPLAGAGQTLTLVPGFTVPAEDPGENCLPLLPWRNERRFQELERMVKTRTLEDLSMCRFSCLTDGQTMDLEAVFYREIDLAEWLTGSEVTAVTASIRDGRWANLVLRMASGVVCGVEAGTALPAGSPMQDRHELIARRGVGCDRVVDSQVPQHSVYTFTGEGMRSYTDTDAELFGLSQDAVNTVRAACEALTAPGKAGALREQHRRLRRLVSLALESGRRCERIETKEVKP